LITKALMTSSAIEPTAAADNKNCHPIAESTRVLYSSITVSLKTHPPNNGQAQNL